MTQPHEHPVDPDTVAEIAPGEGSGAGSVEYGGSEIHDDRVGGGGAGAGGSDAGSAGASGADPDGADAVTTEAGTFSDLPVAAEEQVE